ncbi:MAG: hypothetical protein H6728_00140 [Myxococcales bacterium]|nr:hypothetical protein [Myxococcales bacterium]MCB9641471.1 hypothetical protein [Myxococcales bacterium]
MKRPTQRNFRDSCGLLLFCTLFASSACTPSGLEPKLSVIQAEIFTKHSCTLSSCHGAGAAGGLNLADNPYDALVNKDSATETSKKRVVPNKPDESVFYQVLLGSVGSIRQMPVGSTLPTEKIELVKQWIEMGAPNN